jgi:hypothetical protein
MVHNFRIDSEWEKARNPNPSKDKKKKYLYGFRSRVGGTIFMIGQGSISPL